MKCSNCGGELVKKQYSTSKFIAGSSGEPMVASTELLEGVFLFHCPSCNLAHDRNGKPLG